MAKSAGQRRRERVFYPLLLIAVIIAIVWWAHSTTTNFDLSRSQIATEVAKGMMGPGNEKFR